MHALARGTLVAGRYTTLRLLGQGSVKQVYLAEDALSGEQVALALLAPDAGVDGTAPARFVREGRIGSKLKSPYSIHVLDEGSFQDGGMYIVTEAVLGRSLEDALGQGAIHPGLALKWTIEVLAALEELHGMGIVHRDVKPENVLLARTAELEVAKLTDFGVAKVLDTTLEDTQWEVQTAAGLLMGTPQYMAPEQWESSTVSPQTDLYAVGVMLFELLTGKVPFRALDLASYSVAHVTGELPSLPERLSVVDPVMRKALAKRADQRFSSAREMREVLENLSGYRLAEADAGPELSVPPRFLRAELLGEAWPAPVQVMATPSVLIGRGRDAHMRVVCFPETLENKARTETVAEEHARLEWRGGKAFVRGEPGESTFVGLRSAVGIAVELHPGEELFLGPHVRLRYEAAPCAAGELPQWARLRRTDAFGNDQVCVIVLTEAVLGARPDAAIPLDETLAGGDFMGLRVSDEGLMAVARTGETAVLYDGLIMRVGRAELLVAIYE